MASRRNLNNKKLKKSDIINAKIKKSEQKQGDIKNYIIIYIKLINYFK